MLCMERTVPGVLVLDLLKCWVKNKQRSHDCGRDFLYGRGQVHHRPRDLHFAHAAEEIGDQDAAGVSQEQVGTVARSGHTLALGTHFKLG